GSGSGSGSGSHQRGAHAMIGPRPMQHDSVVSRDAGRARSRKRPFLGRRATLVLAAAIGFSLAGGCRCHDETLAPVSFDQASDREPIDPNSVLAPPWQPPLIAQLDNGALMQWLREHDNPAFHVRVLLPTATKSDKLGAAAVAAALEAIELRLGPRLRRIPDAQLELRSRPGRVEIAIHGRSVDAEQLLDALAET